MSNNRQYTSRDDAQPPFFVGIDLGATNIKVGVVDDLGRPLSWVSVPTEAEKGAEEGSRRMGQAALAAIAQARLTPRDVAYAGLGSPGTMDLKSGMLLNPPNLGQKWWNFPLRDRVSHHCGGLPVAFNNDANCAAYGEFWVGSGRELYSMVLFTLGTGIGGGIIIGDLLVEGENGAGGELGHVLIDYNDNARLCPCGQRGHLEAYAAAVAVIERTRELLAGGRKSSLGSRIDAGEELMPLMLAEEAQRGDSLSLEIIMDTARYLGIGAVSAMHTVDPAGVVFGGAMNFGGNDSDLGRRFLARIKEEVRRRAFPVLAERTVIEFASLGGDAGFIGSAGIARLEYRKIASEK